MHISKLGTLGAEVVGVDVRQFSDQDFAVIYQAWLDCNVLVVRDQRLQLTDYLRYSQRFGAVTPHPSKSTRHPDCPEITVLGVNKFRADGSLNNDIFRRGAEGFHTDGSYEAVPFKATQLYALAIPTVGGDTFFSSAYSAYEALDDSLKQLLAGKTGQFVYGGRIKDNALLDPADRHRKPACHRLIQVHPETGRTLLYFDQRKIISIDGLSAPESDAVIEALSAMMADPPNQYRHQWRKGDVVIWDNRCSYHKAAGDYPPDQDRIHWRVSINNT